MKSVNIYIVVDFRSSEASPWEAILRYGSDEKVLDGKSFSRTELELKTTALSVAMASVKSDFRAYVYSLPEGIKEAVLSDSGCPQQLSKCRSRVSQFYWMRPSDLPDFVEESFSRIKRTIS